ncbi:AraC family transcriptional regulator [Gordoniibacillus kamchatkensis]|uniref:AraC family transcriptional regulator n=1 Tax=Gordoniibacillus kamchatkensis TaxID=1590651 RepID=A0ABR5ADE3_9BACL|nr:AraC family transcriptional regulator [Paenibacillus sp. VKM B-2647]KIL38975.1 AraC family transcriptional regulator [Paenibacillus sp. VKM B-2647]
MDEAQRKEQALQQLALLIRRHAPAGGTHRTAIPSLSLMHATHLSEPLESVYKPSICVVAQGAKMATLAGETYRYDPSTYLVTSVELPIMGTIVEASPEIPYLSLKLSFDVDVILEFVEKTNHPAFVSAEAGRGIAVSQTSPVLLEAIVRLMQLLDAPEDIPVLAPLVIREVLYRMLQGEQGALLYQFAISGSHAYNIAQAIRLINRQYDRPLAVEQLAKSVNMSISAFHKHFKRVTAMSPLQYQKTVRLQEARRLMLTEAVQASDAAFRVGYESPSQFSREYARMYGRPPMLDVQELRGSIKDSKVLV